MEQTSSQLLKQPAVQTAVSEYLVDQLYANVDVAGELRAALPPRFEPLAGPAAGALRGQAEKIARTALGRPRVQQAWEDANRATHALLVKLVVHGGGSVVSNSNGVVTLDLRGLLADLQQRVGIGGRIGQKLPPGAAQIKILNSDQLGAAQTVGRLLKPLALVLVLAVLACLGAAIGLARGHRREMVRDAGLVFIAAGAIALVVRRLAGTAVVDQLATTEAIKPAIQDVWQVGTSLLVGVATATMAYGVLAVAGAWLAGPMALAVRARRRLAPVLRDWRITYGAVGLLILLVLVWGPTEGIRRPLPALALTVLLLLGVEALRRQVARETPEPDVTAGVSFTGPPNTGQPAEPAEPGGVPAKR